MWPFSVELGKSFIPPHCFIICIDGGKIKYVCAGICEWVDVVKVYASS